MAVYKQCITDVSPIRVTAGYPAYSDGSPHRGIDTVHGDHKAYAPEAGTVVVAQHGRRHDMAGRALCLANLERGQHHFQGAVYRHTGRDRQRNGHTHALGICRCRRKPEGPVQHYQDPESGRDMGRRVGLGRGPWPGSRAVAYWQIAGMVAV